MAPDRVVAIPSMTRSGTSATLLPAASRAWPLARISVSTSFSRSRGVGACMQDAGGTRAVVSPFTSAASTFARGECPPPA